MPTLSPLTWIAEQNVKLPADTHVLSYRCQVVANTTTTLPIPTSQTNPAQAQFPGIAPTGEPQQGKRMFVTKMVIRDANGNLGGSGATAGGVALVDSTTGTTIVSSGTLAAATPPYQIFTITTGAGVVNPNDQLQIAYTAPTGATATATGFTVDLFGYFQQGI